MKEFENLINGLITKLLSGSTVEFSQDGLNIKAFAKDGYLTVETSYDDAVELRDSFESYIKSLSDDFFIEVAESFEDGELHEIQKMIDSDDAVTVRKGIETFMEKLQEIAVNKIESVNKDIKETEQELTDLIEIRDSYKHAMFKKF